MVTLPSGNWELSSDRIPARYPSSSFSTYTALNIIILLAVSLQLTKLNTAVPISGTAFQINETLSYRRFCNFPTAFSQLDQLRAFGCISIGRKSTATGQSRLKPIVRMWRFSRTNGLTESFHTKMEMLSRRAYGFRNFENYRLRVLAQCGWDGV